MSNYVVTWLYGRTGGTPRDFKTKASCGFDAEIDFLLWARDLREPVKVVRVEKVSI